MNVLLPVLVLVTWLVGSVSAVQVREAYFGGGYGPQPSKVEGAQGNGVVDLVIDFYAADWANFRFSLGAAYSYFWTNHSHDEFVHAFSLVPSVRFYARREWALKPFVFSSPGLAYLPESKLGDRNLGGPFAGNLTMGAGVHFGAEQGWSISYAFQRHMSNAGFFEPNRGIDVPGYIMVSRAF